MASNEQVNVSSQDEVGEAEQEVQETGQELKEAGQENVLRRVANMPLVSSTYDMAATAYSSTKDSHPYVKSILDVAEKGVKTITEVAVNTAQPILNKLEPQIATANEYASRGLDTLEEKLPILHLTADEIASNTKEMVSSAKEAIANKISGVVDMTKDAVQTGMDATRSAISHSVSTVVESRVGQIAVSGADAILDSAEELIDDYLPMTEEELAELARAVSNGDLVAMQHNEREEYLVRLGSLSAKFRNRAYRHSVDKLKRTRQRIQSTLAQIEQTIRLIEYMKNEAGQKLNEHQEKLRQMVLQWGKGSSDDKVEACVCVEVDLRAITMFQNMIQQLQTTFQTLTSSIQGFPSSLQDKMHQIRESTKVLHASLSNAGSFQELSNTILAQSYQTVQKAQEYMEELREYITHHTPLSWLVGPFIRLPKPPTEGDQRVRQDQL
ncbi:perilipin-3-like [Anolis sagrei]|uniref:perilipin-3-like n=1 Tax=Anolis sagrei TaxID=38937 RepID=UPI0035202CF2